MTYEQSKYMNENANAPQEIQKPQPQGNNNLTYEQSKYNDEYQKRNADAQQGLQNRQEQVLRQRPGDGSQDTSNKFIDTMKGVGNAVKSWFVPQEKEEGNGRYIPTTMGNEETKLYNNVSDNDVDSNTKLYNQGQKKKEMIENVMPKYSRQTWKEIMTNPEYSWDEKLELVMNGIGGALSAGDTGQVQQTDKKAINDAITQQFAENIADRDKRAMNAQIEPIEALNKQQTDTELRLRDTAVGAYIDRYNAMQSAETKRQVLEALINDKGTWADLEPDQKIDTLAYIQALDGEGNLLSMAIQMWAPDLMSKLDDILRGKNVRDAANESKTFKIGDKTITGAELENTWQNNPDAVKQWIAGLVDENGNPDWAAQQAVIDDLSANYQQAWRHPAKELQKDLNQRKFVWEGNKEIDDEADKRRRLWLQGWQKQYDDMVDRLKTVKSYSQKKQEVGSVLDSYTNEMLQNGYEANDKEAELQGNLEKLKADIEKGEYAKSFDSAVSKALENKKNKTDDDKLKSIATLKSDYNPEYLINTYGASDVIKFLEEQRKVYETKSPNLYATYNNAVANVQDLFGMSNEDLTKQGIAKLQYKR